MDVTIRGIPKEILVHTISVNHNKHDPSNMFMIHCYKCGTGIGQVNGEVKRIFPGVEPTESVSVIYQCYKCKEYYTVQTKSFLRKKVTHLVLSHDMNHDYTTFHCVICRTQLFIYNGHYIKSLPEFKKVDIPYSLTCFKPSCGTKYTLDDVL